MPTKFPEIPLKVQLLSLTRLVHFARGATLAFFCVVPLLTLLPVRLAASAELPLDSSHPGWQLLRYDKIPANQISSTAKGLEIEVNGSASPLIYVLDTPTDIHQLIAEGQLSALPRIPDGKPQGDKGADDFAFRWGLVVAGDKTLGFAQKLVAPDWVKTLFSLAPDNSGVDKIVFLSLANAPAPDWKVRQHTLGKGLMEERVVGTLAEPGTFSLEHTLDAPLKVAAFWFSIDGDDTDSQFTLTLSRLEYQ